MLFSSKNCHVSSVNLAELGEENTVVHIQSLSLRNENDFLLKLAVSSRPEISMNFPETRYFGDFPKACLAVRIKNVHTVIMTNRTYVIVNTCRTEI